MLKESLTKLLYKESIHKLSVKMICEDAQINRTTFYKYYGSQYDLLEDMETDLITQIDNYFDVDDDNDDLSRNFKKAAYLIYDNIDLCRLLLNNNIDPDFPKKLLMSPNIASTKLHNSYSRDKFEYVTEFIAGGAFALVKMWLNKENRESPEELADILNAMLVKLK